MRKSSVVVDTNVAVTANSRTEQADAACVLACLNELELTRRSRRIILDNVGLILTEYLKQKPHGFPQGPGDAFLVSVHDNQANPAHARIVTITQIVGDSEQFAEFPNDPDLSKFDPPDRKFVAVAVASGDDPPILNATDNDWCEHKQALERNLVRVKFLCPQLMREPNCR